MSRLVFVVGILLVLGFVFSLLSPAPAIFGTAIVPVQKDELWRLNSE